jgi:hypothetical protein
MKQAYGTVRRWYKMFAKKRQSLVSKSRADLHVQPKLKPQYITCARHITQVDLQV